jgi:hypothetical protein
MNDMTTIMSALADGELAGEELAAAEAMAAGDPSAANEREWAAAMKRLLASQRGPEPPAGAWDACRARLDAIDRTRSTERFVGRYAWGLCAIFLVAILSAAAVNRMSGTRTLPSSNVAGLFTGLQPMGSQPPGQAAENVRRAVGLAPNRIAQLDASVVDLAVGRVGQRRAARLTLADRQGQFVMFVVSGAAAVEGLARQVDGYRVGEINGKPAVSWVDSNCLLIATGDRDTAALIEIARSLRAR